MFEIVVVAPHKMSIARFYVEPKKRANDIVLNFMLSVPIYLFIFFF